MKKLFIFLIVFFISGLALSQNIISTNPATLQVYLVKTSGEEVLVSCNHLNNQFDQLKMAGEISLDLLVTDDARVNELLDSTGITKISYSTLIPEGQFVFTNTVNYKFISEVELHVDELVSRFIMDFEISNMKTNIANNFLVTCTGTISLADHLGISNVSEIQDQVRFQFFQTVRSITY